MCPICWISGFVAVLFGGAIADRFNRKTIILIGQAIVFLTPFAMTILIYIDIVKWYHLLIGSIIQGAGFSIMMPARQAIIPQFVGKANITNAIFEEANLSNAIWVDGKILGWRTHALY